MNRVDFYISPVAQNMQSYGCGLAGRMWQSGDLVHIHTESEAEADSLDRLLWTFDDTSFIPHYKVGQGDAPVVIGWCEPEFCDRLLLNMTTKIPSFASSFERIAEIVGGSEDVRQLARGRYRQYKDLGFELHSHKNEDGAL